MSAQQLADEVGRLGLPIDRPVLSNLETGRRRTISVAEWLVLAAALRVPPILLIFPVDRIAELEVLPNVVVTPGQAVTWADNGRLPDGDPPPISDSLIIPNYRRHAELVYVWQQARNEARQLRELLDISPESSLQGHGQDDPDALRRELDDCERLGEWAMDMLREVRQGLCRAGLLLPELPQPLQRTLSQEHHRQAARLRAVRLLHPPL